MKINPILKLTLLLSSMMTMMAGAVVAPSLPQINEVFSDIPNVALLTRLIITLPALFIAFLSPLAGFIIDKFGRKKLLMFSLVLYAISGTTGWYLNDLYLILIGRGLLGIAVSGIMTTVTTLVGDYFQGEKRSAFLGLQGAFMGMGGVVFISLAGIFADIHWQLPFSIYLFSIPVMILGVIFIFEPEVIDKKAYAQGLADKKRTFSLPTVVFIYFVAFVGVIFFYMMPVQVPFLLRGIDGVSNTMVGMAISSCTLAGSVIASFYKHIKKRLNFPQIYTFVFLFMGCGYFIISQSESYMFIVAGLIVSGFGTGLLMPTGNLWIMEIAPPQIRGRLIGNLSTSVFLAMFLSPVIMQPIIKATTLPNSFFLASLGMGVMVILLIIIGTFVLKPDSKSKI